MDNSVKCSRLMLLLILVGCSIPHNSALRFHGYIDKEEKNIDKDISAQSQQPSLSDCLLSASSSTDCGVAVEGCIWCAEPVYGLCVTEAAAKRMNIMPFFTCDVHKI